LSKNFLDVVFKEYLFSDFLQLISTYDNVIFRLNVPGMRFFSNFHATIVVKVIKNQKAEIQQNLP
jgi:hypothetical protein